MKHILAKLCCAALLLGQSITLSQAGKRVALVIGNSEYHHTSRLANPENDATDIAGILGRFGFAVTRALNLDAESFSAAVDSFSEKLEGADVALLFYAGHGLQFRGENYLVPVDARLENRFSLKRETVPVTDIIAMIERKAKITLVFLDACRNNPLSGPLGRSISRSRSSPVARGLGRFRPKSNETLVVYATAPDTVAADGRGRNSPFTAALLEHIGTAGLEVEVMLKRVTRSVRDRTGGRQRPERMSRLASEFYFNRARKTRGKDTPGALLLQKQVLSLESQLRIERAGSHAKAWDIGQQPGLFRKMPFVPEVVAVPGGYFLMGCVSKKGCRQDEMPVHRIGLKGFFMSKHETTFAQWDACVAGGGCRKNMDDEGWGRGNRPVINISWHDAVRYARWLSKKTGQAWRLPTEAEWEYAARAGTQTRYAFGNSIGASHANFSKAANRTVKVGQYPANRFGIHDMHGNVWEWVSDRYAKDYYSRSRRKAPGGPRSGARRVNRGGCWHYDSRHMRSARRVGRPPGIRRSNVGFRLVRETGSPGTGR